MSGNFINLNTKNIADEHISCIIRSRKPHVGIEAKKTWIFNRLKEGHIFRKLDVKAPVFIEYAPLEKAWVPIDGENYYYIYCLWVDGIYKKKGYGESLMNYCIDDAKKNNKSGICMLSAKKQKAWLSDKSFAKKFGFKAVDTTENGYELLALSFDGNNPKFLENAKSEKIDNENLTIYYSMQCPFIYQNIEKIKEYCKLENILVSLVEVNTLKDAKNMPCVFNNYAVFYKGEFKTVNLVDVSYIKRLFKE
ncbi:GNAT family N-acetyltransferase [Peptoniphilus stercorisuis]|uniref:GNAT superfamily N-acetyltransferase n=1 Tax=Peptoniphilus stercorisuis TaxID=1436965 RepID=A0ABS4KEM7_9FIRM|nr:GNAT family N-acetyltransferase [Peptoniphilus stercorisuis]MBP2025084.1 GNAT superfamily N-acetyltransferase [Peptoniphilus stercorisuis]